MSTWRELEALGIRRCCAVFKNRKRCRKRVASPSVYTDPKDARRNFCEKHAPLIANAVAEYESDITKESKS